MKSIFSTLLIFISTSFGWTQGILNCDTNVISGQNLVVNGGFEQGDLGFTVPKYLSWNNSPQEFSRPGQYFVSSQASVFNKTFIGSPKSGTRFLMIDGSCNTDSSIVWEQEVNIVKNTRYYFEVNIASLKANSPAKLEFEIAGQVLPTIIDAPIITGEWVSFVEDSWNSGNTEGLVKIRIKNNNVVDCGLGNDFALDDISFSANCFFGAPGDVPVLGADQSLCGTSGEITLKPSNLSTNKTYEFKWSSGETTSDLKVTKAGNYAVCMTTNGSCAKSDVINISETFAVSIGNNESVCKEIKKTLNAGFSGSKVSYKWFKDNVLIPSENNIVYSPTAFGTYKVEVSDGAANCGTKSAQMTLSPGKLIVNLGANQELCKPTLANLDAGTDGSKYEWYKDGKLQTYLSGRTVTVNEIGLYKVKVFDAICPADSDEVNVNNGATFSAKNNFFCDDSSSVKQLEILSPASQVGSNFKWYSDEALTKEVATGFTYTTPEGLKNTTTYYVNDISTFNYSIGPKADQPIVKGGTKDYLSDPNLFGNSATNDHYVEFEVFNNLVLDTVSVYPLFLQSNQSINLGVQIRKIDGTIVGSKVTSFSVGNVANTNNPKINGAFKVPVKISLEPGKYRIYNTGTTAQILRRQDLGVAVPLSTFKIQDVMSITNYANKFGISDQWPFFFDWKISSGAICDPVQVKLISDDSLCPKVIKPVDPTDTTKKVNIFIPNAFSPNGDNVNDKFEMDGLEWVSDLDFKVFNQWGDIVFETTDYKNLFDGTRNGKDLPTGAYYYTIRYTLFGENVVKSDSLSLLR